MQNIILQAPKPYFVAQAAFSGKIVNARTRIFGNLLVKYLCNRNSKGDGLCSAIDFFLKLPDTTGLFATAVIVKPFPDFTRLMPL